MIIDAHCHLFTPAIIENVASKPGLAASLGLDPAVAMARLSPEHLFQSLDRNAVARGLLLPTAAPGKVSETNDRHIAVTTRFPALGTLCTLHPEQKGLDREIRRMIDFGIPGVKLSSFSQRFDLASANAGAMFDRIESTWSRAGLVPVVVLDTYAQADHYFGAPEEHLSTPARIAGLVSRHPGIRFVAAHMGGLMAGPDEIRRDLEPAENLFLDTSNASHTLPRDAFIALLREHGARHVLFGTDWPWFDHGTETPRIRDLLAAAGFAREAQAQVFGDNARSLFRVENCRLSILGKTL